MLGLTIAFWSWMAFLISFGLSWLIEICFHKTFVRLWWLYLVISVFGVFMGIIVALFEGLVALINLLL